MSHNRYISWPDAQVLTNTPKYPPAGAANNYHSPTTSRRFSECFSETSIGSSGSGSLLGLVSDLESKGQWQSIGSESKSPLAQFGFFKSLTEKKITRGNLCYGEFNTQSADQVKMVKSQKEEVPSRIASQH